MGIPPNDNECSGHPLEKKTHIDAGADLECWLFPAMQRQLAVAAREAGIPVSVIDSQYSTRQCHECDQFVKVGSSMVTCTTADCPVGTVCRDRSAAATIAKRVGGGESDLL